MPETAVAINNLPSAYSTVGQALTAANCDSTNGNSIAISNGETILLFVSNPSGSDRSITITSQPDPTYGRTGNVSTTVVAGGRKVFHLTSLGWANTSGLIIFNGHSDLVVSAVKI